MAGEEKMTFVKRYKIQIEQDVIDLLFQKRLGVLAQHDKLFRYCPGLNP